MPALHENEEIVAQVQALVEYHRQYEENPLLFACWHHLGDEKDVWLLEIAENVADPGDGSLDTFPFYPKPHLDIPGHLRLTYASPEEFWDAVTNPDSEGHVLIEEIRRTNFDVLYGKNTRFEEALRNHAEA